MTTTRDTMPRQEVLSSGPGQHGVVSRTRNTMAATAVVLALGGTATLWIGLFDVDETPPPSRSTLPDGMDGCNARFSHLDREHGVSTQPDGPGQP